MLTNINTNLADREDLKKTEDFYGKIIKALFLLLVVIFPWVILPNSTQPYELLREILIFAIPGFLWIIIFFRSLKRKEFEWRKTKLNWIIFVWALVLGLIFIYAPNYQTAWEGYPGSLTAGLSEYLAYFLFFFLAVQIYNAEEWKKIIQIYAISLTAVLVFYIGLTIYFASNNVLTINFARTPSLVTAAAGVLALAFWWTLKRTEVAKKARSFLLVLVLFFISSLLDFHIGWWMWVVGTLIILIFDAVTRTKVYVRGQEVRQLGLNSESGGIASLIFHGDAKYLFLILLFSLSRALSPLFLGQQKLSFMPYFTYLTQYPLLGRVVFFYLFINLLVICYGLYYFWKLKKDRPDVLIILSGLACISVAHLLYYSESAILLFLNWILIVYSGLTFLRKPPERDFFYFIKPRSQGKKIFIILGGCLSIILLGLLLLRAGVLWR